MSARVVAVEVATGQEVAHGQLLLVIEAMKMEHELRAAQAGVVQGLSVAVGDAVAEGELLLTLMPDLLSKTQLPAQVLRPEMPISHVEISPALEHLQERLALTQDAARPAAMAKRRASLGTSRSARENLTHVLDEGSFVEYGQLAIAAQATRRSVADLRQATPADGMVCGTGALGGMSVAALAYDATVLAGTQGLRNHQKTDRVLELALAQRLPTVLFAEGGGGRPGDVDMPVVAGLHVPTFARWAALKRVAPLVAVVHGRCFAGNAALAGVADVLVATRHSNLGLGGPAMVEGGGLGQFPAEAIGPAHEQAANGVVDVLCENEAEATTCAKAVLLLLAQHPTASAPAQDVDLQTVVPQNRQRAYDARQAVLGVFDAASVVWLGAAHGLALHTALARLNGHAVGVLASNPAHLGGALDAASCRKASRFMRLLAARGLPLVSFIDSPGFMVGPDEEARGQVRAAGDWFAAAAEHTAPKLAVVLRKAYGLGAMVMAGGSLHSPAYTCAWPSAEFGAMGLEGAVRLGFKKELEAVADPAEREALFETLLQAQYDKGTAIATAESLEIDAVIDPAHTRELLVKVLGV